MLIMQNARPLSCELLTPYFFNTLVAPASLLYRADLLSVGASLRFRYSSPTHMTAFHAFEISEIHALLAFTVLT